MKKTYEKDKERLRIIEKIKELEKKGIFDVDAEEDLPTKPLLSDDITYLDKSFTARIKQRLAFISAYTFFGIKRMKKEIIIGKCAGVDNMKCSGGAIITSNHFNPFDSFAVQHIFDKYRNTGKMYRIIREGNYTSFEGFYGFLMRNCRTLPLSRDIRCAHKLSKATEEVLKNGDSVLIYPEKSLWWNYTKPKPTKSGAYDLAVRHRVPIIPIFFTMSNSGRTGKDGFPVLIYHPHIGKPIYPDISLTKKEASRKMQEENFDFCKTVYENFYGVPLKYLS